MEKRVHKTVIHNSSGVAAAKLKAGFDTFGATRRDDHNDGAEECAARLYYQFPGQAVMYVDGHTKNGNGHAEMDAILTFWLSICKRNVALFVHANLWIACRAKSCCVHCSGILGCLGISPYWQTYKSRKSMGISYAIHHELRRLLCMLVSGTNDQVWKDYGSASY